MKDTQIGHAPASVSVRAALHTRFTFLYIHIVLILQVRRSLPESAPSTWFLFQPFQSFLQKPLYPLVGMTTTQANGGGSVGNRHPVGQE
jgi:hypothetical protein